MTPGPRLPGWIFAALLAALVAVCLRVDVGVPAVQAQEQPVPYLTMPANDGGFIQVPPGGCKNPDAGFETCTPVRVTCNHAKQWSLVVQNRDSSNGVRLGSSRVQKFPAVRGIRLGPGEMINWDVGSAGTPFAVADTTNDAGVILDVICGGAAP